MTATPKSGSEQGGKHRWRRDETPWIQTVAGQIEHAEPGAEAPHRLGWRGREPRHARDEGTGGGR